MAYSISGISSLGTITRERTNLDSQLFQQPIPRSASSETIVLDLFGTIKTITLEGIYTGTPSTFIGEVQALMNGKQATRNFVSDASGATILVILSAFDWNYIGGEPNKINYTITMTEAKAVS